MLVDIFIYIKRQKWNNEELGRNFTHYRHKHVFAELDNSFQILEEYFLNILYYSQCNGDRHNIL